MLIVFLSSRISPRTSTVIFLDRSPLATAVVTSAMLRTCPVKFDAMKLTLSVKSFQVPATPRTSAWPPSLPSVPTSRATRVTSEAKPFNWSTIVLIVFLSARISPFTSTVILRERSPLATAVVTSAMLRTWAVRFDAIEFTLSVRSFQVPATPGTAAWPPSLPSVPTSRATRVTSDEKPFNWSTIVLMVSLSSRISPLTSTVILRDRSPRATAVVTAAILRTCAVRFDAIALTLSVRSFQVPPAPGTTAWPPRRPSVPTSRATRVTSEANDRSWSTIVLMASLSCRISPRTSTVIFLERSPSATAIVTSAMLRTCAVRLPAIRLTDSVRSFHTPDTPLTCAWPPSLPSVPTSRATRVTSEVKTESCSIIVLTSLADRRNSPFKRAAVDLELHRLAQVSLGDGADGPGDLDGRPHQVVDQRVDRVSLHRPVADGSGQRHALLEPPFLADRHREPAHFPRDALFARDRLIERLGNPTVDAGPVRRQSRREVAVAKRHERLQDLSRPRFGRIFDPAAPGRGMVALSVFRVGERVVTRESERDLSLMVQDAGSR